MQPASTKIDYRYDSNGNYNKQIRVWLLGLGLVYDGSAQGSSCSTSTF